MVSKLRAGIDARLLGARRGGISTYTDELIVALAASGLVDLAVFIHRHDTASHDAWGPVRRIRTLTPPHHPREAATLGVEIGWRALDVFHFPDFIPPRRVRGRCVITIHDLAFLLFPEFLTEASRRYYNSQIRRAVEAADRIVAVSATTKQDLVRLLGVPAERIDVVHEAPRALFRDPVVPPRLSQLPPGDYVLFVGTIEPRKNLDLLIRALAALDGYQPGALRLVVAGAPGWLAGRTQELPARLGIADRVTWLEQPTDEALRSLYHHARCLVLPSRYEGFGLPVVEAMACGTPVVLSDIPALREVGGDVAHFCSPDDAVSLAGLLARLGAEPQLRRDDAARGRERAAQFSWQRAATQTVETYWRALG